MKKALFPVDRFSPGPRPQVPCPRASSRTQSSRTPDQIEADRYVESKKAVNTSGTLGVICKKLVPPGAA